MEKIKQTIYETEKRYAKLNEEIAKEIVETLENKCNIKYKRDLPNGGKLTYVSVIITILMTPDYAVYKRVLLQLLENVINERGMLFCLLGVTNQLKHELTEYSYSNYRKQLLYCLHDLPYHKKMHFDNAMIKLNTKYGEITVYRYDKIVQDKEIYRIIKTTRLANQCHSAVHYLKDYYPDSYIITSEIPLIFQGEMYHSYFKTKEGVIDISNNMFYKDDDFNKLFNPNELLKIKTSELEKAYIEYLIETETEKEELAPVLSLAIHNKIKNISKS